MPTYELARGVLDPGLFSDNAPKMQDFYLSEAGLDFIEELVHSPTYRELMFTVPGGQDEDPGVDRGHAAGRHRLPRAHDRQTRARRGRIPDRSRWAHRHPGPTRPPWA